MIDNLIQLVDSLTECVNPVKVIDKDVRAFQASSLPIDGYVWPTLEGWKAQEGYRVILIEAPGAVGKSAAARQMAHGLKWPLVDASSAQVGSYSLSGLIADAVGFESAVSYDGCISRAAGGP